MNKRVNIEQNRVFHLEDSMIMYGVYNVDTLEKLIQMVHKMNTKSVSSLDLSFCFMIQFCKDSLTQN